MELQSSNPKRLLLRLTLVSIAGAILAFIGELGHKHFHVWILTDNTHIPLWITLVYFPAFMIVGTIFYLYENKLRFPLKLSKRTFITELLLSSAIFSVPFVFPFSPSIMPTLVLGVFLFWRLKFKVVKGDVTIACIAILVNHATELLLSPLDLYQYSHPAYWGFPLWLAPFWGCMGLSLRRLILFFLLIPPKITDDGPHTIAVTG